MRRRIPPRGLGTSGLAAFRDPIHRQRPTLGHRSARSAAFAVARRERLGQVSVREFFLSLLTWTWTPFLLDAAVAAYAVVGDLVPPIHLSEGAILVAKGKKRRAFLGALE